MVRSVRPTPRPLHTADSRCALPAQVATLARSVRHAVGGTSGALYDVAFTAAAAALRVGARGGSVC